MSRTPFFILVLFLQGEINRIHPMAGNRCDASDISVMKVGIILDIDFYGFRFLSGLFSQEHIARQ
ncbi:hypothetical protein [Paraburkholderia hospita]|jgi:hypothetical protein|uniref:hypothetical protein n=1 Tax=Paraburkholderia hospita TaxID=169430 RepID=UPI00103AD847|nr:hypothetical protein [Paraburkholderia hospita]